MRLRAELRAAKLLRNGAVLEPTVPINLSIKNAPDDVVQRLRERAARNHRSLQGELMAIIEEAARPEHPSRIRLEQYRARVRALGLQSHDEAAAIVRADRDGGHRDH
jgi:plasmid stability protein